MPDVEKSLELNPNLARALDTRGHIFEALGRRRRRGAALKAAIQMIDERAEATCQILEHIDHPAENSVSVIARRAKAAAHE